MFGNRILLVYPEIPLTYWSMRYALTFIGKKATNPPLGLLTVAAMLPEYFELTFVDMNVSQLTDKQINDADFVFTSSMMIQQKSLESIIKRCNKAGKPVIAGGPYPSSSFSKITGVTSFVLNEAEVTLPLFVKDLKNGKLQKVYKTSNKPNIEFTPSPRFDLIDMKAYANMALQYSRGCPYDCEFCDIVELFGHKPRTKTPHQFIKEMDVLYENGWRGSVFIVDDNFIGNKKNVKELLKEIINWQKMMHFPFTFFTEATVNLAEDEILMDLMVSAGFNMVFMGIETPEKECLKSIGKFQNLKNDLYESICTIQRKGMEVSAGFIVGFDNDPADIFDRQIGFINKAGIPIAMVGLLIALPQTRLQKRLEKENRMLCQTSGNNTHDLSLNFIPKMDVNKLLSGYKKIIANIYSPSQYFERCLALLKNLNPNSKAVRKIRFSEIRAFWLSIFIQTFSKYGLEYWKFIFKAILVKPKMISEVVTMAVKGHHFFKITRGLLDVDCFKKKLNDMSVSFGIQLEKLENTLEGKKKMQAIQAYSDKIILEIRREYGKLNKDFQVYAEEALLNFEMMIKKIMSDEILICQ